MAKQQIPLRKWITRGVFGLVGILMLVFGASMYQETELGYVYVFQNSRTGNTSIVSNKSSFLFVDPIWGHVTRYKATMTIDFSSPPGSDLDDVNTTLAQYWIKGQFADTYVAEFPITARLRLPSNEEHMLRIHQDFRNQENLVGTLLEKSVRDIVIISAQQYTGEEAFQGGLNAIKALVEDQLNNGLFETVRKQVVVESTGLVPVSSENTDTDSLERTRQLVWKTVPVLDSNGEPKRLSNPLEKYGITVLQVTMGTLIPHPDLAKLIADKQALVATRVKAIEQQVTAKAEAQAAQLHASIETRKQVAAANREKELAIIEEKKETDVALAQREREIKLAEADARRETIERKKVRDLALIDKDRALREAEADLAVQEARAEAAEAEARAIRLKGLAEAEVKKAFYDALGSNGIYMAELNRDVANNMFNRLGDFNIDMPEFVVSGDGSSAVTNPMEILMQLMLVDFSKKSGLPSLPAENTNN